MTDLGKSAAAWKRQVGEELGGLFLAACRELQEMEDKFSLEREQLVVLDKRAVFIDVAVGVELTGIRLSYNTLVDGSIIARVVDAGGGNWTVTLYKATGGGSGDRICAGTAAAGAAVTLATLNGSGVSGTWELPGSPAATTGDELYLWAEVDYLLRAARVLDGSEANDTAASDLLTPAYKQVAALMKQARQLLSQTAQAYFARRGFSGQAFTGRTFTSVATETTLAPDGSGSVVAQVDGFAPFIKLAMHDETTGGEQDVLTRVMAAGAGAFDGGNAGAGTIASHTPLQHCPVMIVRGTCIAGKDTGNGGAEKFALVGTLEDGTEIQLGVAQVKQQFSCKPGFGPFTILRAPVKTGDDSHLHLAAVSYLATAGERGGSSDGTALGGNTSLGRLYGLVEANASNWDFTFWATAAGRAARIASQVVAKATNIATGATFSATEKNSSQLQIDWKAGSAPVADTEVDLDLMMFVVRRADGQHDQFEIAVTLSSEGLFQRYMGETFGYHLNYDTAGNESIGDGYVEAGTFPPRAVLDN